MDRDPLFAWALVAGMAASAFCLRALFVLPGSRLSLPPAVERVLRFAPAAALMAIIVPQLVAPAGVPEFSLAANPRFAAGVVAFAVAAATRNIILTIASGMAVLTLVRLVSS